MRLVETSAFVAAPLGGMTLARLGAEVIRVDAISGPLDSERWPVTPSGASLFWAGLNKGKKSILLDLKHPEGRELLIALVTAPGESGGHYLTNLPSRKWSAYESLCSIRPDLIMVQLQGHSDGTSAVDYTVQPATGFPMATGPRGTTLPVNSLLPVWDLMLGMHAALALVTAELGRRQSGEGDHIQVALSDIAYATVSDLGRLAQAELGYDSTSKDGNFLYGAFGADFETRDGRRVMVVALTDRQWLALKEVTEMGTKFSQLGALLGRDLDQAAERYEARDMIEAMLRPWFAARTLTEVSTALTHGDVAWGPFQTFEQLARDDDRCSPVNPVFGYVHQPGVGKTLAARSPLRWALSETPSPQPAPAFGQHTDEVLTSVLGLSSREIGRLRDRAVVR